MLWFPPVLFFLVIVLFSIYFGIEAQGDAGVIPEKTASATPYILLTVQLLLLGIQLAVFRRQGLTLRYMGWQAGEGKEPWKELALGAAIIPFTIADVLLAPFVEENIYRGYGLTKLLPRVGETGAVLLSSFCFGLLHWSSGFWYILITGLIVGIPFAILRLRRGNILVPFGAHRH